MTNATDGLTFALSRQRNGCPEARSETGSPPVSGRPLAWARSVEPAARDVGPLLQGKRTHRNYFANTCPSAGKAAIML